MRVLNLQINQNNQHIGTMNRHFCKQSVTDQSLWMNTLDHDFDTDWYWLRIIQMRTEEREYLGYRVDDVVGVGGDEGTETQDSRVALRDLVATSLLFCPRQLGKLILKNKSSWTSFCYKVSWEHNYELWAFWRF